MLLVALKQVEVEVKIEVEEEVKAVVVVVVIVRAGLRVVPEWSYERQWKAHFSAQAQCFLTLVHL